MTIGKELIYATRPFMKENVAKSWFVTLSTLFILIACQAAIILIDNLWIQIPLCILTALVLVRFFVIYHDYMHETILTKSKIARVLFVIFGQYVLTPASIWKRSHNHHHKHNAKLYSSSIGSYPIVTKEKFNSLNKSEKRIYLFIRNPFTILFAYVFGFVIGMCLGSFTSSPKKHWDSLLALILHAAATTLLIVFIGLKLTLLVYLIPIMISHALGAYLFYAQHNFPGVTFEVKDGWTFIKAALESSSYMKMPRIMHWFTANIGYHHIHHLNAGIPFYRLPEVLEKFPELQQAKTTSLMPSEIIRCLKLKVWDPSTREMVGLS